MCIRDRPPPPPPSPGRAHRPRAGVDVLPLSQLVLVWNLHLTSDTPVNLRVALAVSRVARAPWARSPAP
eukprot:1481563-Prymnesium_polylepis.1